MKEYELFCYLCETVESIGEEQAAFYGSGSIHITGTTGNGEVITVDVTCKKEDET